MKNLESKLRERLGRPEKTAEACAAIVGAVKDGLVFNEVGMDLSEVQRRRSAAGEAMTEPSLDADVQMVMDLYLKYAGRASTHPLKEMDLALRHRPRGPIVGALRHASADRLAQFMRDGFLRFEHYGLDMGLLESETSVALRHASDRAVTATAVELRSIEPILRNKEILELASAYMGTDVRVGGYKVVRVGREVSAKSYLSGLWHHDNCGSRVKLVVFLQHVGEDGTPTEIAKGSHNLQYWDYNLDMSRFDAGYVREKWGEPAKMTGPKGGGFIFDTNSIHRGNVDLPHLTRDTVILDIAMSKKIDANIPDLCELEGPCPCPLEGGTHKVNLDFPLPIQTTSLGRSVA